MKVRATISFSGLISMYAGEVREVEDSYILNDLMKAGYVVPAEWKEGIRRQIRIRKAKKCC